MRVLFVCVHNSGRSQMAEAFLNHFAREKGVDALAESAGTLGGKEINPAVVAAMGEVGIQMEGHFPKRLDQAMADRADRIVSMGCGVDAKACPARFLVSEDWGLDDPSDQPLERIREIRDQIRDRVQGLLGS